MRAHVPHDRSGGAPGSARQGAPANGRDRQHSRTNSGSGLARLPSTLRDSRMGSTRPAGTQSAQSAGQQEQQQQIPSARRSVRASQQQQQQGGIPDTQSFGTAASSYRAASRESSKENMAPADAEEYETQRRRIEELKAEVGTLQYQVNTYEQEREMARLQHETELREARRKAEDDFKQRQAADAARAAADRQLGLRQRELDALRSEQEAQAHERARPLREALETARGLRAQLEDLGVARDEAARRSAKQLADAQAQMAVLQQQHDAATAAAERADAALATAQAAQAAQAERVGGLEAEVLRLKAQTGDAATMAIIRRELTDQVNHIRALEATNRDQLAELRHLRQTHRATAIVEEEKRSLLRRLDAAQQLEAELAEERRQRQRLEAEHRAWAAYLQREGDDGEEEFDSPAAVAKALMEERYRTAALTERIGAVEAELAQRDADLKQQQEARSRETTATAAVAPPTVTAPAPDGSADNKIRARLERQRALAVKEVEYLRAQLRVFDTEDSTFHPEQFDQQKADRIGELEALVDQYRAEAEGLQAELARVEEAAATATTASAAAVPRTPASSSSVAGTKRGRPDDDDDDSDDDAGRLARKTRKLQGELAAAQLAQRGLATELAVAHEQLAAAQAAARVRVLALRSNPTADHEAVKQATLAALQRENAELLAQVRGDAVLSFPTVPQSTLSAARREVEEAQAATASAQKAARRLKEVWAAKSAEFKEAVESTLGWHVTFIPNGKMRVESVYQPSRTDENENSIVFDGERGTMKVGGGPRSAFAQRIDDQIRFWVREKGCIPGFLAALTLEFYEEQARGGNTTVTVGR